MTHLHSRTGLVEGVGVIRLQMRPSDILVGTAGQSANPRSSTGGRGRQTNDTWNPGLPPLPPTCSVLIVSTESAKKKANRVVELAKSETHEETVMTSNDQSDQNTKTWQLDVSIDAHEERTRAKVQLSWRGNELVGVGLAHLNPDDEPVVEIGDELAVARALSDLANQLFALTASDIEASTHKPVTGVHH
jgi:hypothetical protein